MVMARPSVNCYTILLFINSVRLTAGWGWSPPKWSWTPPSPARCVSLTSPAHGTVHVDDKSTLALPRFADATYACNDGYALVGAARRLCIGYWLGSAPECKPIYNPQSPGECTFSPDGGNCFFFNSRSNEVGWDKIITITKTLNNGGGGLGNGFIDGINGIGNKVISIPKIETKTETVKLPNAPFKKRSVAEEIHYHASQLRHDRGLSTTQTITVAAQLTWNGVDISIRHEMFEVGVFTKSNANNFVKFRLSSSGSGISYSLHVAAHCLPDPPNHLDDVGDVKDDTQSFRLSFASNTRQTVCLNLKDTVTCSRFTLRFIASVLHSPEGIASIRVDPEGVYHDSSTCVRVYNTGG